MVRNTQSMLLALALLTATPVAASAQVAVESELRRRIETLRATGTLTLDGRRVAMSEVLAGVYERRGFTPLWSHPARAAELVAALRSVEADGLPMQRYRVSVLDDAAARQDDVAAGRRAELDLLRTYALFRAAHDLRYGSVDATSLRPNSELDRPLSGSDALAAAAGARVARRVAFLSRCIRARCGGVAAFGSSGA